MKKRTCGIILVLPLLAFVLRDTLPMVLPPHFPSPVNRLARTELREEKIELGRYLFYDPVLSRDNSISCASCHSPYQAFAHTDHALSHGIGDSIGTRNAPALFNLAWQNLFMWDGAVNHIEVQALAPLHSAKEMAEDIAHVAEKLRNKRPYPLLFYKAFGDSTITGQHILKALAQFELNLVSANSKYDRVILGRDSFSTQERKGYRLFQQHCNSCHQEPLFSTYGFETNGLPVDNTLNDYGRWNITHKKSDSLLFKVPSLRNLSYSYPYMHDGRFTKLHQVLNFYATGIHNNPNLKPALKNGLPLNANDKVDLIAFLLCLNDQEFVRHPGYHYAKIK